MRPTHWTWSYEDEQGRAVEGDGESFPTRSDAETWIGEAWRALRERGVEHAQLLADGTPVHGPLSLRGAD